MAYKHQSNRLQLTLFSFLILLSNGNTMRIYDNLIHCYRGNETQPWIGHSIRLLIELIQKIEVQNPTHFDMRTLSANIFHRLRIDGIERVPGIVESELVTPYRANGKMTPKFNLLKNLISHTTRRITFENYLTPTEICHLHKLISIGVEPYMRGDETKSCPVKSLIGPDSSRPDPFNRQRPHMNVTYTGGPMSPVVLSPCPLEKGVVRTFDYGSFTPGTVIGAIAAGLQPQNVRIQDLVSVHSRQKPYQNLETMELKDTRREVEKLFTSLEAVDNTYAAGLSGDLAEVCVYQGAISGTNVTIGLPGRWNDTYFPRYRYIPNDHQTKWDITDAEILAGIDSLFISKQIQSWANRIRGIRLSQVLDMYYSHRGVPSIIIENANKSPLDSNNDKKSQDIGTDKGRDIEELDPDFYERSHVLDMYKKKDKFQRYMNEISALDNVARACHRKHILNGIDLVKLKDETIKFAEILQYTESSAMIFEDKLKEICEVTVEKFVKRAEKLIEELGECKNTATEFKTPAVDLTLVIDGSRTVYENQKLIFHIAEILQLNSRGSHLSVIHGTTGQYMVNRTNSISNVFDQLRNFSDPYPFGLNLKNVLVKTISTLINQTETEQERFVYGAPAQVMLIVSQGARLNQEDFDASRKLIEMTFHQLPDLYYIFLTNHRETVQSITASEHELLGRITIMDNPYTELQGVVQQLEDAVKNVPKKIIAPFCKSQRNRNYLWGGYAIRDDFDDYISPQEKITYRVNQFYFNENFEIHFQGLGYGDFTVCMSRDPEMKQSQCRSVTDMEYTYFRTYDACPDGWDSNCPPMYFTVTLDKSYFKCAEIECRYPDQVKYLVKPMNLRCKVDARYSNSSVFTVTSGWFLLLIFVNKVLIF